MNLTWEDIKAALECTQTMSKTLLKRSKQEWKKDFNYKLLDNQRIPTWYFISKYSDTYGVSKKELCNLFNYDIKLLKDNEVAFLSKDKMKEKLNEPIKSN